MFKYFPYLRGKKYEVIAVDNLATSLAQNGRILPIFEPVKVNSATLVNRSAGFAAAGLETALILNPEVGELSGNLPAVQAMLLQMRANGAAIREAWIVTSGTTVADLANIPTGASAVFIHRGIPQPQVVAGLQSHPSAEHVFHEGYVGHSYASQYPLSSRVILFDGFQSQVRNAAYPSRSFFTDRHRNHSQTGFTGFGEFQIVGFPYSESGGPALAVAIHMTEEDQNEIWCNHFISVTNATPANPAGKFAEALTALESYVVANPGKIDFSLAYQTLHQHYLNGHFPGLGDLKRICLQHHLELMTAIV